MGLDHIVITLWRERVERCPLECLSDEAVRAWEQNYTSEDAYYEEEDDE